MAFVKKRGPELGDESRMPLGLDRAQTLLHATWSDIHPDFQEDAVRRYIRARANGFGVWIRELVRVTRGKRWRLDGR